MQLICIAYQQADLSLKIRFRDPFEGNPDAMRIHQQEGAQKSDEKLKPAVVTYLNHDDATSLSFDATISVVKNLSGMTA